MNRHHLTALWTKICHTLTEMQMNPAGWDNEPFNLAMEELYPALLVLVHIARANTIEGIEAKTAKIKFCQKTVLFGGEEHKCDRRNGHPGECYYDIMRGDG